MAAVTNILWEHPKGDTVQLPCCHLELAQTGSIKIPAPTSIKIEKQHDHDVVKDPFGKNRDIPCLHFSTIIENGTMDIPVYQLKPEHEDGHESPVPGPCIHPLEIKWVDTNRHLVFYTDDLIFRNMAIELVDRLRDKLHVRNLGSPWRPLQFFFREAVDGDPSDSNDPFWNHYDPNLHAIQITRDPGGDFSNQAASGYAGARWQLPHELGHAIVGQKCVKTVNEGDPHVMKEASHPGEAMSEGWANFVRVALRWEGRGTPGGINLISLRSDPNILGSDDFEKRDTSVPKTNDIEYNVMCILWDLYDISTSRKRTIRGMTAEMPIPDDDTANSLDTALSFEQLFGVFSPSLDTLPAGPVIWDVDDYLSRLKKMYPDRSAVIDAVKALHID